MALDDFVQAATQSVAVQTPAHAEHLRNVVLRISGFELVKEPEPLLGEAQRQMLVACCFGDGRRLVLVG